MAADGDDSARTETVSPGSVPAGGPSDGGQDRAPRPARPASRTWWILPYFAGALAVFLVAGLIIGLRHPSGPAKAASQPSAPAPMPAEMFPDALFGQLTADIQAGNESAFLSLASPAARPAMTAWWDNLRAIGFTTGAVVPTASLDAVHIDRHGDGSTIVLAGAHSPLDPVFDLNGKPDIAMTRYRIGLHFSGPGATGQVTSWQPLDDAPWDLGSPLYVQKAQYVVVAGPPGDRALVDQTLPAAEAAAAYDIKLMGALGPAFLHQQGFVVFVSGSAAVRNSWLAATAQPVGWPPLFLGARTVQLPGPGLSADTAVLLGSSSIVKAVAVNTMGGARVVFAPTAKETPHDETVTLVRDFMLDIMAALDESPTSSVPLSPLSSWSQEGLAVAVQFLFESNPDPLPRDQYSFKVLTGELRGLPRSYRRGTLPSTQQLFGPSVAADEDWGYVAASAYEYIALNSNMKLMMVSGVELYAEQPTPFGNVYKSGTNIGNLKFYGIHSIEKYGWAPWLANL
jgi:hypothetical protein